MKIKVAKQERLDDASIKEVMKLLEQESPITKKDACAKLNISYNTKRLENIINEFKERRIRDISIRKTLRKKELDFNEKKEIIEQYLANTPISELTKMTYRSIACIKKLLSSYNIPIKGKGVYDYFKPPLLEEEAVKEDYKDGDLVFSARYGCLAEIVKFIARTEKDGNVYRIYLLGIENQYAHQPYYELADLSRVQSEFNIKIPHVTGVQARPLSIK